MPITATQQGYVDEIRENQPAYTEAENFYRGKVEDIYASQKVLQLLAKSGLNDLDAINFAKIPVDALVNRLEITAVTATTAAGDGDLSEQIGLIWDRNLLGFFAPDVHKKTSYFGDCYVLVWPVYAKDNPEQIISVDIRVNSPITTRVFYDPEDPLHKLAAAKVWSLVGQSGKPITRANFYYPDRIERWITREGESTGEGYKTGDWDHYIDETSDANSWYVNNPFGEVPIFHHRTDFPYGTPDNYAAWVPQIMINKLVTSHASTIDFQSFPQRYFLTDPQVDDTYGGADLDSDFPTDEANDPESPYNTSGFRADPGEVWISSARQAGQFEAAPPDTFIAPFNRYVLAIAQTTETPFHEFDPSGNVPSGESLKVAEAPLVNRANMRKLLEGSAWEDMWGFVLSLLGFGDTKVKVHWKNSASNPGPADWDLAFQKFKMGVPRDIILAEMGYKPEDIEAWSKTPGYWLSIDQIISLVESGIITSGPELEKVLRRFWQLPPHPDGAPYGRPDPSDLDYGTVEVNERRAALGLPPTSDGNQRATAAAPALPEGYQGSPANAPGENPAPASLYPFGPGVPDGHLLRMAALAGENGDVTVPQSGENQS